MTLVHVVIGIALLEYFVFFALVGRARVRSGLKAPATSGNEQFERCYRVQQNTLEQLILFIPSILLFGYYVHATAAAILGMVFVIGRAIYCRAYMTEPASRGPGFGLTILPSLVMMLGGLGGAVWALINS